MVKMVGEDIINNLGRLWLVIYRTYTELQGDFTCFNSYLLTLGTLIDIHTSIKEGSGLALTPVAIKRIVGTF